MALDSKLNAALGINKEAPQHGAPGVNAELVKGKIVDEYKVNDPTKNKQPKEPVPTQPQK